MTLSKITIVTTLKKKSSANFCNTRTKKISVTITPCTQVGHPHKPQPAEPPKKKERVNFSRSTVGLNLSPAAGRIKGSPRYCQIAHHLARLRIHFLPTSCASEEQRQSRCNHSGGKVRGKWGIGGIGRYILPRSTLRCVQIAPYVKQVDSV